MSAETQLTQVLTGEDFKLVFAIFDNPQVLPSDKTWSFISSHSGQETIIDDSADQRFEFSPDMSTLTIMSVSLLDDGVYTVRANNPAGSDSDSTRVTVYGKRENYRSGVDLLGTVATIGRNCLAPSQIKDYWIWDSHICRERGRIKGKGRREGERKRERQRERERE